MAGKCGSAKGTPWHELDEEEQARAWFHIDEVDRARRALQACITDDHTLDED
jgi:hypothetical protein